MGDFFGLPNEFCGESVKAKEIKQTKTKIILTSCTTLLFMNSDFKFIITRKKTR
jgi:hypothetical protein